MKKITYFFVVVFLLCACFNNSTNGFIDSKLVELRFNLSDSPLTSSSFATHKSSYVFIADFKRDVVYLLNDSLEFLDSINIGPASSICELDKVSFYNLDTIVCACNNYNQIVFIDRFGNLILNKKLRSIDSASLANSEVVSSFYDNFSNYGRLVFEYGNGNDLDETSNESYTKSIIVNNNTNSYLVSFSNWFQDSVKLQFGFNLFNAITPNDSLMLTFSTSNYGLADSLIFVSNFYTNQVFVLNYDLKLETEFTVKSDYTSVGAPIYSLKSGIDNLQEIYDKSRINSGWIDQIHYSRFDDYIYVVVIHDKPEAFLLNKPFSILKYDRNYNKIDEYKFEGTDYIPQVYNTNIGMYILKNNGFKRNENKLFETQFDLYNF